MNEFLLIHFLRTRAHNGEAIAEPEGTIAIAFCAVYSIEAKPS